ncbi:MAG: ABC transporter ATP-binding protein [Elusimicrobiota bacterium]|nr:ABC transporter ATP-binding protein [Elusimicrobiota bacterium]
MNTPKPILEIQNLNVYYYQHKTKLQALRNVSFKVYQNELLGIIGESGSGKSTLGLSILKLIESHEGSIDGEIIFYEDDKKINLIDSLSCEKDRGIREIRGRKISIVFQDPYSSFNPVLRIGPQIEEVLTAHKKVVERDEVIKILKTVKVPNPQKLYNMFPHQLSGGLLQRALIGMAIILAPKVLIADEPTTALDVTTQKEILELLKKLKEELSISILLITHNFGIIKNYTDRVLVMYAGEIIEEGKTEELVREPLHPYTKMLQEAIPSLEKRGKELKIIPGQPPDIKNLPQGCKFYPRCPLHTERCIQEIPPMVSHNKRKVRCFKTSE